MRAIKYATVGGLIGLAVLHADSFAKIGSAATGTFRNAILLGGGK